LHFYHGREEVELKKFSGQKNFQLEIRNDKEKKTFRRVERLIFSLSEMALVV
jgi:hypothetical protein